MALGERIRLRRDEKALTATALADMAGLSKGYLSELESGRAARPSGDVLYRLATALGTTVADLLEQEVRPASREVPASLRQYAEESALPEEDVRMLAQIRFRGEQPATIDDWRYLYESIRRSIPGRKNR